jgi:predicted nucleic acid-binding protein
MIFVDTSFWVAYRNRRDAHHDDAVQLMTSHGDAGLVTTNHVRGETWTYLRRRAGHRSAVGFLDALATTSRVSIEAVDQATEDQALKWLRQHDEREYSFVDATSFVLMRRHRLHQALAFDGDFGAAGFVELRP